MGKINQKQNGSGVTFGSGRSYLCLEERIEWERGEGGGQEKERSEKKKAFNISEVWPLVSPCREALLTWTVWTWRAVRPGQTRCGTTDMQRKRILDVMADGKMHGQTIYTYYIILLGHRRISFFAISKLSQHINSVTISNNVTLIVKWYKSGIESLSQFCRFIWKFAVLSEISELLYYRLTVQRNGCISFCQWLFNACPASVCPLAVNMGELITADVRRARKVPSASKQPQSISKLREYCGGFLSMHNCATWDTRFLSVCVRHKRV